MFTLGEINPFPGELKRRTPFSHPLPSPTLETMLQKAAVHMCYLYTRQCTW